MHEAISLIENGTVWITKAAADGAAIRVVVEPMPNGLWDWTVWQDGRGSTCRHGVGRARIAALGAAQAAAHELELWAA